MNHETTGAILIRPRNHMMPLTNPEASDFLADGQYIPEMKDAAADEEPRGGWYSEDLQD